jgi:hypothetical protein
MAFPPFDRCHRHYACIFFFFFFFFWLTQVESALYIRGDPYESTDAVFGVKKTLIIDLDKVGAKVAAEYGVDEGIWLLKHDFVLVTEEETETLRDQHAVEALEKLGLRMKLVDHLPVPELD